MRRLLTCFCLTSALAINAHATDVQRPEVQEFINRVAQQHSFERGTLEQLLAQSEFRQDAIDAITRPAEGKPWHEYRPIFLTETRIKEGAEFMAAHRETLKRAEQTYGVPAEVITAIIGVETRYGTHAGKYRILDALVTLGFDYPPRAEFFRKELEQYLLLTRENKLDPLALTGSYAGAMGYGQFIASSYRKFAVDFDGDKVIDIINNPVDAIGSVANYLAVNGWERNEPLVTFPTENPAVTTTSTDLKPKITLGEWRSKGYSIAPKLPDTTKAALITLPVAEGNEYWLGLQNFYTITRYNRSPLYAMAVYQLSQRIRDADQLQHQAIAEPVL
jgi:membrane-bound lytic murein transglycosylase B